MRKRKAHQHRATRQASQVEPITMLVREDQRWDADLLQRRYRIVQGKALAAGLLHDGHRAHGSPRQRPGRDGKHGLAQQG